MTVGGMGFIPERLLMMMMMMMMMMSTSLVPWMDGTLKLQSPKPNPPSGVCPGAFWRVSRGLLAYVQGPSGVGRIYAALVYCNAVTTLHCTSSSCAPLHLTVHSSILHSAMHSTVLHCTPIYCTIFHCTPLHSTVLHCTALHCTVLHCTALHCRCQPGAGVHGPGVRGSARGSPD